MTDTSPFSGVSHFQRVGKAYVAYLLAVLVPLTAAVGWTLYQGSATFQTLPSEIFEGYLAFALWPLPLFVAVWVLMREYEVGEDV